MMLQENKRKKPELERCPTCNGTGRVDLMRSRSQFLVEKVLMILEILYNHARGAGWDWEALQDLAGPAELVWIRSVRMQSSSPS